MIPMDPIRLEFCLAHVTVDAFCGRRCGAQQVSYRAWPGRLALDKPAGLGAYCGAMSTPVRGSDGPHRGVGGGHRGDSPPRGAGIVYLVGAGPGDPSLITRRGAKILSRADVVVYDRLVNPVLLDLAPPACERIYAGKKHAAADPLTQSQIESVLVDRARAGKRVVRLKGGDPFVFGRGAEECRALVAADVPFEVVPGVTSATAVCAYAGIPLTARGVSSTVAMATGHEAAGKPDTDIDWAGLARAGTVVLFMAVKTADECARRLIAGGKNPATPAAAVYWGTTPSQRTVVTTLEELGDAVRGARLRPPALLVIGDVVAQYAGLNWYERRPLFSRRVLVTRRVEQSGSFVEALAELGAEAVCTPVTRLAAPADPLPLRRAIGRIRDYDWVVFTSANAVDRLFSELSAAGLDSRALGNAKVACVGPATARAVLARGIAADLSPARGNAKNVAAEVTAAAGVAIAGALILVPRAEAGLDDAVVALRAAGASVEAVAVYRTEPTPADSPEIAHGIDSLRRGAIDVCAFFAPSHVSALFDVLGADAAEVISGCAAVAAVGNTTARALAHRGLTADIIPATPGAESLARAIADHFDRQED